jgi:hypothetical protein
VAELNTSNPEQRKKADKANIDLIATDRRMGNPVEMSRLRL